MFDLYKKRLNTFGVAPSNYHKNNHDEIVNDSFCFDPNYKRCLIDGFSVDAKFQVGSTSDIDDDKPYYQLEFRPSEPFKHRFKVNPDDEDFHEPLIKMGTIIDIPEDDPIEDDYEWWENRESDRNYRACYTADDGIKYRRWMIVDISRQEQDRKFYIVECDWCAKWIVENPDTKRKQLYKQLGVCRIRNSYSSGIYEKYYFTAVEAQDAIWLPTNEKTKLIDYDQRFMISDNELHPQSYKVSAIYSTKPVGVMKFVLTHMVTETDDDYENMIANGESSYDEETYVPEIEEPDTTQSFYLTGTNDSDDAIYMNYDITFNVDIVEPSNESLKQTYSYDWSYSLVDDDGKLQAYLDDIVSSGSASKSYTIFVEPNTKLVNKKMQIVCNVTCKETGEIKSYVWDNLRIEM